MVYGLNMKSSVKARKKMLYRRAASCGENPEIRGPQMHNTQYLVYGLHLAYAGVKESVRTQDLSHEGHTAFMTCRHSGTTEYRYLNACDCMYWHCMLHLGEE